jgi:endonuclease YncB( thermonuclease family)
MHLRRLVTLSVLTLLATLLVGLGATPAQAIVDRDCGDFATQAAAQTFFLGNGPSTDPHRLDADGDGIACDANPCPCSTRVTPLTGTAATPVKTTIVQYARVTSVADGDTVNVRLATGANRRVRLLGIDTPEVYGAVVECGGPAASAAMKKMLPVGTRVQLVSDSTQASTDRYGRLLRYVSRVADGRQVNRAQVYLGNATVYVYNGVPFKRTREYRTAQASAKAAPRGIWKTCA